MGSGVQQSSGKELIDKGTAFGPDSSYEVEIAAEFEEEANMLREQDQRRELLNTISDGLKSLFKNTHFDSGGRAKVAAELLGLGATTADEALGLAHKLYNRQRISQGMDPLMAVERQMKLHSFVNRGD